MENGSLGSLQMDIALVGNYYVWLTWHVPLCMVLVYGIFDLKKSIQFPGCSLSIGDWRIQGTGGEPSSC